MENSAVVPEVRIVQGVPTVAKVTVTKREVGANRIGAPSMRTKYEVLNDPEVMMHIQGTYDTYKCNQCATVLSGYKRGDPDLSKHVWKGDGRCDYVKAIYRGREKELLLTRGKTRFQMGFLAFPEFTLYSNAKYVTIDGTEHCVVCARPSSKDHYIACAHMTDCLETCLNHLVMDVLVDNIPLFPSLQSSVGVTTHDVGCATLFGCAVDNGRGKSNAFFDALGESANMRHVPLTADRHKCSACGLEVENFVKNDTLLGEHVYYSQTRGIFCSYIAARFNGRKDELRTIFGKERYRKGTIAYPGEVADSKYGYSIIGGQSRCVVCSAVTTQGQPAWNHYPQCEAMKNSLRSKLKIVKLIM